MHTIIKKMIYLVFERKHTKLEMEVPLKRYL